MSFIESKSSMHILYFGKFSPFHSTENYVTHALREKGIKVTVDKLSQHAEIDVLKRLVQKHSPSLVLFSKVTCPAFEQFIPWCKSQGLPTVCWLWDLYYGYRGKGPVQFNSDLLLTTDGGHDKHFALYNHKVLRQGIHQPDHQIFNDTFTHDVAFVGGRTGHPNRVKLIRWLKGTYRRRFIHHTHTRGINLNKSLAKVKIVIGDSYPSNHYWSNRCYEIMGRGGFFMHPETLGFDKEYEDGTHYVSYPRMDRKKLKELIQYYITHDEEREKIRRCGWSHTGTNYTYGHRVNDLMRHIRDQFPSLQVVTPHSPAPG